MNLESSKKLRHTAAVIFLSLIVVIIGIAAFISSRTKLESTDVNSPNIIFFLVDDLGWQDVSEPFWAEKTLLNEKYNTPNVELLADQGIKFTNAYACNVCSPTRVSLLTGMNAARHRVTNWTLRRDIYDKTYHQP